MSRQQFADRFHGHLGLITLMVATALSRFHDAQMTFREILADENRGVTDVGRLEPILACLSASKDSIKGIISTIDALGVDIRTLKPDQAVILNRVSLMEIGNRLCLARYAGKGTVDRILEIFQKEGVDGLIRYLDDWSEQLATRTEILSSQMENVEPHIKAGTLGNFITTAKRDVNPKLGLAALSQGWDQFTRDVRVIELFLDELQRVHNGTVSMIEGLDAQENAEKTA